MKKNQSEKFERTFKALSKAAFDAGLSFQKFSEVLIILEEAAKRESKTGDSLRVQLLNA